MKDKIPFSDFAKLDLRVGEIKKAEEHPNADKLFVLKVDFNEEERTIVAGLRGYYDKEELEGKKAIFITNLEPTNLRGVESNGMILAAVSGDRKNIKILMSSENCEVGSLVEFKHG